VIASVGLTRVRRFNQDDAHIFCRADQLADEMRGCLTLVEEVYGVFGFEMSLRLSTRPEKYVGEIAVRFMHCVCIVCDLFPFAAFEKPTLRPALVCVSLLGLLNTCT
jgi:hypothetical protein